MIHAPPTPAGGSWLPNSGLSVQVGNSQLPLSISDLVRSSGADCNSHPPEEDALPAAARSA